MNDLYYLLLIDQANELLEKYLNSMIFATIYQSQAT